MNRLGHGLAGTPKPLAAALFLLVLALPASAAVGTGLAFLRIGAGGRAIAMGDAVVSQVQDASATYWNPGALGLLKGSWAEVTHNESMQGVRYEFVSLAHRSGKSGVGISWHGVWTDRLHAYDDAGEPQGEFGYYDMAVTGSYGLALGEKLGVGATVEYVREVIDVYSASGAAFGLGVQAREILPRVSAGVALRHYGSSVQFESQKFDLPSAVQGGVSYLLPMSSLNGRLLVSVEGEKVREQDAQLLLGTEYQYLDLVRLQFGYRSGLDTQDISMGFGVGNKGVRGQYAFVPFDENLGNEHRISLSYNF